MTHETETLDAATAELMLYVAGELDAEGRAAFEHRLAADAALRAQAIELGGIDAMLKQSADAKPLDIAASRQSLARILRVVREHVLVGAGATGTKQSRRPYRVPTWAWGSGLAAAVIIGLICWIVYSDPAKVSPALTQNNENRFNPGEFREFASAFGAIDNGVKSEDLNEMQSQVDALSILATMSESMIDTLPDASSDATPDGPEAD